MIIEIVNQSSVKVPRAYIEKWALYVFGRLEAKNIIKKNIIDEFNIIFVGTKTSKNLNKQFRGKNKATDVLSFFGDGSYLGELVICSDVCKKQSKENKHSYRDEAAYLVLHGILHLLGYEHEDCEIKAREMFSLQDSLFEEIVSFNK